ncbi:collagen alpha-1(XII) chain-like isoform X2 [Sardina pilchardus]|uniref:collagen alpha-1(XII) chain-like isoform X2 n=1 Tax=Sardina pilchardus TaxID=27697 RepID=UPI002E0FA24B
MASVATHLLILAGMMTTVSPFPTTVTERHTIHTNHTRQAANTLSGPELAAMMAIGIRVMRGQDWNWGDEDGNPPGLGSVIGNLDDRGWLCVRWDNGNEILYRMGTKGKYDLMLAGPLLSIAPTTKGTTSQQHHSHGMTITTTPELSTHTRQGSNTADIAFLLDGSLSVSSDQFSAMKTFVRHLIGRLLQLNGQHNFAFAQYSTECVIHETFNQFQRPGWESRLNNITQIRDGTCTASAIWTVVNDLFISTAGARPEVNRILIVITDGQSGYCKDRRYVYVYGEAYRYVTGLADRKYIERYAVGVGNAWNSQSALNELKDIASSPESDHVFTVDNFEALYSISISLEKSIIAIEVETPMACSPTTTPEQTTYTSKALPTGKSTTTSSYRTTPVPTTHTSQALSTGNTTTTSSSTITPKPKTHTSQALSTGKTTTTSSPTTTPELTTHTSQALSTGKTTTTSSPTTTPGLTTHTSQALSAGKTTTTSSPTTTPEPTTHTSKALSTGKTTTTSTPSTTPGLTTPTSQALPTWKTTTTSSPTTTPEPTTHTSKALSTTTTSSPITTPGLTTPSSQGKSTTASSPTTTLGLLIAYQMDIVNLNLVFIAGGLLVTLVCCCALVGGTLIRRTRGSKVHPSSDKQLSSIKWWWIRTVKHFK